MKRKNQSVFGSRTNVVPCGKCLPCVTRYRQGWTFRLLCESKNHRNVNFLTLTYDDDHLPRTEEGFLTLDKEDYQRFMKALRKKNSNKLKYYMCGEYGGETLRPHYHLITYGLDDKYAEPDHVNDLSLKLEEIWSNGTVQVQDAGVGSMAYVAGYVNKKLKAIKYVLDEQTGEIKDDPRQKEFTNGSKKLGMSFLTPQMIDYLQKNPKPYIEMNGSRWPLPRYFKEKVYGVEHNKILKKMYKELFYRDILNEEFVTHEDEIKKFYINKHKKLLRNERQAI